MTNFIKEPEPRSIYIDGKNSSGSSGGFSAPISVESNNITFDNPKIYYTFSNPGVGNLTQDLSGAKLGIVQKIYHEDSVEPELPNEWILIGNAVYSVSELNIIYCEYINENRIEYWIVQEA